jgi:hypothetical protein
MSYKNYKEWEERVLRYADDNEDLIVCYYEILRALWRQGESAKNAANEILDLDGGAGEW